MGWFAWLGVVAFFLGLALWFVLPLVRPAPGGNPAMKGLGRILALVGIVSFCLWRSVFYAEPGYSYAVQYFTGRQVPHMEAGFHFRGWGQVIEMKKVLTVKFSKRRDADYSGFSEPFGVRFNDAVQADISASIRIKLPSDPARFLALAIEYRNQENLVNASLMPAVKEVLRNSARMISAQEYILGKGGKFENAVLDQLQSGIYELMVQTTRTSNTAEPVQQDSMRTIDRKDMMVSEVNIKTDADGRPIRKKHAFIEYGIEVSQAVIDDVDPEENFKNLLAMQRDAAGKSNVARQEAQKAEFEKQRVVAQGETEKSRIRVDKEKEQIHILMDAETAMKRKKTEVDQQRYSVEATELEAKAIKLKADAEAYARERIMKADNALEKRLEALVEINKAYAEAIKGNRLVPNTVITGGGADGTKGNAVNDFIRLLTVNAANQVNGAMNDK